MPTSTLQSVHGDLVRLEVEHTVYTSGPNAGEMRRITGFTVRNNSTDVIAVLSADVLAAGQWTNVLTLEVLPGQFDTRTGLSIDPTAEGQSYSLGTRAWVAPRAATAP